MGNYVKTFLLISLLSVSCYLAYQKLVTLRYDDKCYDADTCKRFIEYYLQETARSFVNRNQWVSEYDVKRCKRYAYDLLKDEKELADFILCDSEKKEVIAFGKEEKLPDFRKLKKIDYKPYFNLSISDSFYDKDYKAEVFYISNNLFNAKMKNYLHSTEVVLTKSLAEFLRKAKLEKSDYICVKRGKKELFHIGEAKRGLINSKAIVNGVNWTVICK